MKKYLLLLIICCCSLSTWADTEPDAVTAKVSGTTVNVALTNSNTYVAFQMDIKLPSGVSIAENGVAPVAARLSQTTTGTSGAIGDSKFIVAYNKIDADNNIYRIIAYNLNNAEVGGQSGDDILTITLSAAATSSNVELSGVIFVDTNLSDLNELTTSVVDGYEMGDVNHDTKVDAIDLALIINYILGKANASTLDVTLANMNGDTKVDAIDLALLINKILGK